MHQEAPTCSAVDGKVECRTVIQHARDLTHHRPHVVHVVDAILHDGEVARRRLARKLFAHAGQVADTLAAQCGERVIRPIKVLQRIHRGTLGGGKEPDDPDGTAADFHHARFAVRQRRQAELPEPRDQLVGSPAIPVELGRRAASDARRNRLPVSALVLLRGLPSCETHHRPVLHRCGRRVPESGRRLVAHADEHVPYQCLASAKRR